VTERHSRQFGVWRGQVKRFRQAAFSRSILTNSLKVSCVVGSILNVVNQGSNLVNGGAISWPHFFLNFLVPFCVANYSGAAAKSDGGRND
jgi:hypothetical protein